MPVSCPHRHSLPLLRYDNVILLVRPRKSFCQPLRAAYGAGAGGNCIAYILAGAVYGDQRKARLAAGGDDSRPILAWPDHGTCRDRLGVENLHPPSRDRWVEVNKDAIGRMKDEKE